MARGKAPRKIHAKCVRFLAFYWLLLANSWLFVSNLPGQFRLKLNVKLSLYLNAKVSINFFCFLLLTYFYVCRRQSTANLMKAITPKEYFSGNYEMRIMNENLLLISPFRTTHLPLNKRKKGKNPHGNELLTRKFLFMNKSGIKKFFLIHPCCAAAFVLNMCI